MPWGRSVTPFLSTLPITKKKKKEKDPSGPHRTGPQSTRRRKFSNSAFTNGLSFKYMPIIGSQKHMPIIRISVIFAKASKMFIGVTDYLWFYGILGRYIWSMQVLFYVQYNIIFSIFPIRNVFQVFGLFGFSNIFLLPLSFF